MTVLSDLESLYYIVAAGFPPGSWARALAVVKTESGGNPQATNNNGPTSGCPFGSTDYGLFQINGCYHPEILRTSWSDPLANAKVALAISKGGTDWSAWQDNYQQYMNSAQNTVNQFNQTGGVNGGGFPFPMPGPPGPGDIIPPNPIPGSTPVIGGAAQGIYSIIGIPSAVASGAADKVIGLITDPFKAFISSQIQGAVGKFVPFFLFAGALIIVFIFLLRSLDQ